MTGPELAEVIKAALTAHQRLTLALYPDYYCCTCGERSIEQPSAHQARAVLAALTEAGTVEWGVAYNLSDGSMFVDPCVDRGEADLRTGWDGAVYDFVVSRLTLPWAAVE